MACVIVQDEFMITKERVYSASIWAQVVKKQHKYACALCGSVEDVQAVHKTPPSLGGRNTLENGITKCLPCRSKAVLAESRVRFNFSVPFDLFGSLDKYCQTSGRSINDVIKQILADFIYDSDIHLSGNGQGLERNDRRVSVPIRKSVFESFTNKCRDLNTVHSDAVKCLLHKYLEPFERG
jgi:hypothetical protein